MEKNNEDVDNIEHRSTDKNSNDQDIMNEAKSIAIQYFKDKYNLDVEITNQKKLPTYVASEIDVEGHVVGHKDQSFIISVNYKTQKTDNIMVSPEFKQEIINRGFDPNK